jgi:NADPH-dependent 2,4-dienoyl-CoA reductase/sulfur reductase-like enzyme
MPEHHAAVDTATVESETMKKPPLVDRALIVGGGLGGLAAAIQLRKFGIDAQVRQTDRELFFLACLAWIAVNWNTKCEFS